MVEQQVMTDNAFKARDIGLRAQKKILSRMATKTIVKTFIDGTTASLLDNVYRLVKMHTNKKHAEKMIKNIIKTVIKIGVLHRNNMFNEDEVKSIELFRQKFLITQMAVISFHEVDFSFDRTYMQNALIASHAALFGVVRRHLTEKTLDRISSLFEYFGSSKLLEFAFLPNSPSAEIMGKIVEDLNKAMDSGDL